MRVRILSLAFKLHFHFIRVAYKGFYNFDNFVHLCILLALCCHIPRMLQNIQCFVYKARKYALLYAKFICLIRQQNEFPMPLSNNEARKQIVMIWRAFHHDDVISLVHIDRIMDQNVYKKILEDHILVYIFKLKPGRWVFLQDNDSNHTSKIMTN